MNHEWIYGYNECKPQSNVRLWKTFHEIFTNWIFNRKNQRLISLMKNTNTNKNQTSKIKNILLFTIEIKD